MFTHEELSKNSNLVPFGLPVSPFEPSRGEKAKRGLNDEDSTLSSVDQDKFNSAFSKIVFDSRTGIEDIAGERILLQFAPSVNIVHSDEEVQRYIAHPQDNVMVISKRVKNNKKLWFVENNGTDKKYIIAVQNIIQKALGIHPPMPVYLYEIFTSKDSINRIRGNIESGTFLRNKYIKEWEELYLMMGKYVQSLYMEKNREYTVAFVEQPEGMRVSELSERIDRLGLWQYASCAFSPDNRDVNFVIFESSGVGSEQGRYGILSRNIPVSFSELSEDAMRFVAPHSQKMENVLYGFANCDGFDELNVVLCELAKQRKRFYFEKMNYNQKKNSFVGQKWR